MNFIKAYACEYDTLIDRVFTDLTTLQSGWQGRRAHLREISPGRDSVAVCDLNRNLCDSIIIIIKTDGGLAEFRIGIVNGSS